MSSSAGDTVKLSVFGESHGAAVGCVIQGLPAGEPLDQEAIALQMARRAPGRDKTATPRITATTISGAAVISAGVSPRRWCLPGRCAVRSCAAGALPWAAMWRQFTEQRMPASIP